MSSNINPETGEYISNEGRSPRLSSWAMMLICSCVTLTASVQVKKEMDEPNEASKWAVGGSTFSLIVSFFIFISHLHPIPASLVVGSLVEGISAFLLIVSWSAVVAIVTNTGNDLGVVKSDTNQVGNGNLYYFSWAAFVLSFVLTFSYLRSARGMDLVGSMKGRGDRVTLWAGYLASSIVILGSAARILNEDCSSENSAEFPEEYCKRTKLAVAVGSIGFIFSIFIFIAKLGSRASYKMPEFWLASLLAAVGGMGVAFITSQDGPGRAIGNLYYFSWIACILAGMIAVECINSSKGGDGEANSGGQSKAGGATTESMPDPDNDYP